MKPSSMAITILMLGISLSATAGTAAHYTVQAPDDDSDILAVGDYAPNEMNRPTFQITDWQVKGLSKPDYDTQWVQIRNRYVLIKIADDQIIDIVPVQTP